MRPVRRVLLGLAALLLLAGLAAAGVSAQSPGPPNVVVILTDDQTYADMEVMTKTRRWIGESGTTFSRHYSAQPTCCPNRAAFLTGQFPHNTGVRSNVLPDGGHDKLDHRETLPVWLQRKGYQTAHFGKYLNGFSKKTPIPPGWSTFEAIKGRYYNYDMRQNGVWKTYGAAASDYSTDVLANRASTYLAAKIPGSAPVYAQVWPNTPHRESDGLPAIPAPRHEGLLKDKPLPRGASFDEEDVSDKPAYVRNTSRVDVPFTETDYRRRQEALLAVDGMVKRLVTTVKAKGELDNTIFVFASDNGHMLGAHRLQNKNVPYDEATHLPLLVRGPGFAVRPESAPVSTVDITRTIAEKAGATPALPQDGRSLLDPKPDRELLIDGWSRGDAPKWTALRTLTSLYVEYEGGERELYDLVADPDALESKHDDPVYEQIEAGLAARLGDVKDCAGANCP